MDLLLYVIRRAEVDIADIPIAGVADQFVGFLDGLDRIDIDQAGEFLVMAATLMEIKSRTLAPAPEAADDEGQARDESDPRADLVRHLLAYKAFRDAAEAMEARRQEWALRFPARGTAGEGDDSQEDGIELEDADPTELARVFAELSASVNFERLGDHRVVDDDTPIELHAEDIIDRLSRSESGSLRLTDVFRGRSVPEVIGLFLATLELVRRRAVVVEQDEDSGAINISAREESEDAQADDAEPTAEVQIPDRESISESAN